MRGCGLGDAFTSSSCPLSKLSLVYNSLHKSYKCNNYQFMRKNAQEKNDK